MLPYYLLLVLATLLFSLQFMFNNGYQKENGSGLGISLKFTVYNSIIGLILVFFINKCHFEFSVFSLIISIPYSAICVAFNYFAIKAFEYANLSVYSIFSMIGGMLLPFFYGVATGDEMKLTRIICCALITLSVILTMQKGKSSKKAFIYYIGVFILNGLVGVFSAFHQGFAGLFDLASDPAVDSGSFLILTKIVTLIMSFIMLMFCKDRSLKINLKSVGYCTGTALFNSLGNLFILIALAHQLPPSVNYTIITGGVIVFSVVIDLIRKNPVSKKEILAAAIACLSTVFMTF